MIYYTLRLNFVVPTTNTLSNIDIIDQSNISFHGPFQNATVDTSFVLGWNVWITGNNGQINNSGGPLKDMTVRAYACLLYTSPSPRDLSTSRMPSSA